MMMTSSTIDDTDRALVGALQENAQQRLEDLAKLVRMVPSSVHDRLRRLVRDGVIRKWTIDIDATAFGLDVVAFIGVRATKSCSELLHSMEPIAEIEEFHSVAGAMGLMLKVRVANTSALLGLIDRLRAIPGVVDTETQIVLKTQIDRPTALPAPVAPEKKLRKV
jgi:Lrp/AsnC family transcriptional regulator, leucine-responsive regulatory protein